jgi:hypothetical protein
MSRWRRLATIAALAMPAIATKKQIGSIEDDEMMKTTAIVARYYLLSVTRSRSNAKFGDLATNQKQSMKMMTSSRCATLNKRHTEGSQQPITSAPSTSTS